MDFDTFVEEAKAAVKDRLPDVFKDADYSVTDNFKLNDRYTGLSVRVPGQTISPTINLNEFFQKYNDGASLDEVADRMAEIIQQDPKLDVSVENLLNYDKSKLFIRVTGMEANKETLMHAPYTQVEDMAITYHVVAAQGEQGIASTLVNNALLVEYGISKEQLHQDALENSQKLFPAQVTSLEDVLRGMMINDLLSSGMDQDEVENMLNEMLSAGDNPMKVVSNEQKINGAAVIFYPEMCDKIGEQLEGNYFVLPSSVHECLVLPDDGSFHSQDLKAMVTEINATQVAPQDRLTDEVYHYDVQDHVFEKAERFESRMQEKEASRLKAVDKGRDDVSDKKSVIGRLQDKKDRIADQPKNPSKAATKQHKQEITI